MIIQLYSPLSIDQGAKLKKSIIFQLTFPDKVVFGPIFSTFVVYTRTIIIVHLGVAESGGYLPRRLAARQISTTIQLHLSE